MDNELTADSPAIRAAARWLVVDLMHRAVSPTLDVVEYEEGVRETLEFAWQVLHKLELDYRERILTVTAELVTWKDTDGAYRTLFEGDDFAPELRVDTPVDQLSPDQIAAAAFANLAPPTWIIDAGMVDSPTDSGLE